MTYASKRLKCGTPIDEYIKVEQNSPKVCRTCYEMRNDKRTCGKCSKKYTRKCNLMFLCERCASYNSENTEDEEYEVCI